MGGFGSLESITVGGDVVFVGFSVNGEMGSFEESFDLSAGLFGSSGVCQGAEWVNETGRFPGGKGVK